MLADDCDSFRQRSTSVSLPEEQEVFHFCNDKCEARATLLGLASIWKISARMFQSSCYFGVNRLQDGEHFMMRVKLKFGKGFRVRIGDRNSQSAEMVLAPGDAEGDAHNRHRGADQWLFVISGNGTARVNEHRYKLSKGSLMFIERGDEQELKLILTI